MRRVLPILVTAILLAMPALAQSTKPATKGAKESSSGSAMKTMTEMGTVASVSATSLTVKGKTGDMTFTVDEKTHVSGQGASHKGSAKKGEKMPAQITDVVHEGDQVTVRYHDMGGTKHAADVRVRGGGGAKK